MILLLFYCYIMVGVEVLNKNHLDLSQDQYQLELIYASFDSFGESFLLLFQIVTESSWASIIFDYTVKYKNAFFVASFFISFHMINNLILLSLLKGKILFNLILI